MEASSPCSGPGSASCTMLNCLDDLLLLGACYISLVVFFISNVIHWRYQFKAFGFEFESKYDEHLRGIREQDLYVVQISRRLIAFEAIGLLGELGISIALLAHGQDCPLAFASVIFSAYLFFALGGRLYSTQLGLQSHSAALYLLQWLCTAYSTVTMFFEAPGLFNLTALLLRLTLFTFLCLIHGITRRTPPRMCHGDSGYCLEPGKDDTASIISRLTFSWMDGLIWRAFKKPLEAHDLYRLNQSRSAAVIATEFRTTVCDASSLILRMFKLFKSSFLIQAAWAFIGSIIVFARPFLIQHILQYLQGKDGTSNTMAWLCVLGLLVSGLVGNVAECQASWIWGRIGAEIRSVLLNEIYAKTLRKSLAKSYREQKRDQPDKDVDITTSEDEQTSDGNMLNLISVDVEAIAKIGGSLHLIWVNFPVQMTVGTYLLYELLGAAGIIGLICAMALLPLNLWVSRRLMVLQSSVLVASDARIQTSNEVLNNIRAIKYSAWELPFMGKVLDRRHRELKQMRARFIWWSISMILFLLLPALMTSFGYFFYTVVWGKELGSDIAFPAMAVFAVLRMPINRLADSINYYLQAYVSFKRISKFLVERDTDKYAQLSRSDPSFIGFDNATLRWPLSAYTGVLDENAMEMPTMPIFRMENIRIKFRAGTLNVVCGPSGSGKSSLLLALAGEMELLEGQISFGHEHSGDGVTGLLNSDLLQTIAYCPQEPWIMNRSIRANILLGTLFDASRYETVLHAVALLPDLATLDEGDRTIAGENGSKLSGGQKQRIALARALYSHSKHVLLDDCLSAVDPRTAQHVFFHAITGPLMYGRTCIFATHHIHLAVPNCGFVVMLDDGRVKVQGTCQELISAGFLDAEIMETKTGSGQSWDDLLIEPSKLDTTYDTFLGTSSGKEKNRPLRNDSDTSRTEAKPEDEEGKFQEPASDYVESKPVGSVSWSIVKFWLGSMGRGWYWVIVLMGFGIQQITGLGLTLWIQQWSYQYDRLKPKLSSEHKKQTHNSHGSDQVFDLYYLIVYLLIIVAYVVISFSRDMAVFYGSLTASLSIYERLLGSILRAKFSFFDRVPLGQITNRFSRDVEILDQSLVTSSLSALQIAGFLVTIILLISVYIPAFLTVAVVISIAYYGVGILYLHGARDLRRIEAVERSPLYQQFGETIAGSVSIRAYARISTFTKDYHRLVDRINSPYLLNWASQEWLTFRIGCFSSLILFSTGAFIIWREHSILPSAAGLLLNYAAAFSDNVLWLVQLYSYVQQNLNSVERIEEYVNIEQEASGPPNRSTEKMPTNWPLKGFVRFKNYTARYAPELTPALKGVSFDVAAGKRTAIVGRTGAGKSTLALALIRGLEAEGGQIEIDGTDITAVTLRKLRRAVALVPQDPKLFEGSLRDNLSPLAIHDDDKLLEALRSFQVLGSATDPESITYGDLDRPADTLSRGQRQMLCIARGALRRSRVFVLDEATASVDQAADAAVQMGLRANIVGNTTILTIAHRLISIADYDHVIVLDAGQVVEQGCPRELLSRCGEDARFRRMCEDSGDLDEIVKAAGVGSRWGEKTHIWHDVSM